MVPIGDRPAVGHVTRHLRAHGIERLVVNVHHRPMELRAWAAAEKAEVSEERELLGTAGGVLHAAPLIGSGDVLVWNGDILSDLDTRALSSTHDASGALATLAVVRRPLGEGNVGLGAEGVVVRLRREVFGREVCGADFVGVHIVGAKLRARLPARGCLVGDVYLPALREGARIASCAISTSFIDVGSLAGYAEANRAWLVARGTSSWASADAVVSSDITGSIVGAGARVEADAIGCVIWPRARVTARVESSIVTEHGLLPIPQPRTAAE
jgi:mannose-1-phosphate guanylyltransferase